MICRKWISRGFVLSLMLVSGCATLTPPVKTVHDPGSHRIVSKIKVRGDDFRFSGKILMRMSGPRNLLVFLTPMNQIVFKLYIEGERSVLLNLKKGQRWSGSFVNLFDMMTGMTIQFQQLRKLILEGIIPEIDGQQENIKIDIPELSGEKNPRKIEITGSDTLIRFIILKRTDSQVAVNWSPRLDRYQDTDLETVLTND